MSQLTLRRVAKRMRSWWRMVSRAYPCNVTCNACGWRGRCFLDDDWHQNVCCPRCDSSVRHRLLSAAIDVSGPFPADTIFAGKRVLHFAAEPLLGNRIRDLALQYVTADFLHEGVDLQLDITSMPTVPSGSVDLLIACDVLEHVPDYHDALTEIHRVLAADGLAILTVPQEQGRVTTYEDASLTSEQQRREAFGQHDHLRIFGDDFAEQVAACGFEVSVVDRTSLSEAEVVRHRLAPPPSPRRLATNDRRVFFCRRRQGQGHVVQIGSHT
jgi:SAM-dependent methyltransferase